MDLQTYRKLCLERQTELRRVMGNVAEFDQAMDMFFIQHAMLHSAKIAGTEPWSFEDAVLGDMFEDDMRHIPKNEEHSVIWTIWHIARIEDVAMNLLVAGSPQIFHRDGWQSRLGVVLRHTGNAMDASEVAELSANVDIKALRDYRLTVGRRTRNIVQELEPDDLTRKVDPARLELVMAQGALVEAASGIADYWGRRNIAGLLLMPATRHNLVHLNEALKLKGKRR